MQYTRYSQKRAAMELKVRVSNPQTFRASRTSCASSRAHFVRLYSFGEVQPEKLAQEGQINNEKSKARLGSARLDESRHFFTSYPGLYAMRTSVD